MSERDFSWWSIQPIEFDEDKLVSASNKDLGTWFTTVPSVDMFPICNNYVKRVQATIRQIRDRMKDPPCIRA